MTFRALRADEVECRVSQIVEGKGLFLLLYKDARCDMRILDETLGMTGWQNSYETINGELFCTIGVYDKATERWVYKQSNGTPSNTEAEKGRASDAFKRACFMLGIGRELYTAPKIWIPASKCNIKQGRNGKLQCYDEFTVERMEVEDGKICALEISVNGSPAFKMGAQKPAKTALKPVAAEGGEMAVKAAKARLWAAVKAYAEKLGSSPDDMVAGVKRRPDFADTADFYNMVAEEFEAA